LISPLATGKDFGFEGYNFPFATICVAHFPRRVDTADAERPVHLCKIYISINVGIKEGTV
jgi:hypothetical protein